MRYFGESKLIVTSRTHYFESTRMQARFLEQLDQPVVARLAPLSLSKRIKHLHAYAEERGLSDKFERIRRLVRSDRARGQASLPANDKGNAAGSSR